MTSPAVPLSQVRPAASLLRALGDENRLRMIVLLSEGALCVCHIADALSLSQPNASQHLSVLKNAGLVEGERRGSWIYYRLLAEVEPGRDRILQAVLASLDPAAARADREQLRAVIEATPCR